MCSLGWVKSQNWYTEQSKPGDDLVMIWCQPVGTAASRLEY